MSTELSACSWELFLKTGRIENYLMYKSCTDYADLSVKREREQWELSKQEVLL